MPHAIEWDKGFLEVSVQTLFKWSNNKHDILIDVLDSNLHIRKHL